MTKVKLKEEVTLNLFSILIIKEKCLKLGLKGPFKKKFNKFELIILKKSNL